MNAASRDLTHHLAVLCERLQHPTNYEGAVLYFLEEFAGDTGFMRQSEPDGSPQFLAVLRNVASKSVGRSVTFEQLRLLRVREHRFFHGNAVVAGRIALFFYFGEVDTGALALIPGMTGEMEVARFRVTSGLPDPTSN